MRERLAANNQSLIGENSIIKKNPPKRSEQVESIEFQNNFLTEVTHQGNQNKRKLECQSSLLEVEAPAKSKKKIKQYDIQAFIDS